MHTLNAFERKWAAIFTDIGLDDADAEKAAEKAREICLALWPNRPEARPKGPIAAMSRLLGFDALPFVSPEDGRLELVGITRIFNAAGMQLDVALAFAKVVVEAIDPEEFYQPLWEAAGRDGRVDLRALRTLDVRSYLEGKPSAPIATARAVTKTSKPTAKPTVAKAATSGPTKKAP